MRILAIRGANLASLKGSFEIDLAKPPLCHLGLFAIAGPVGAGKSTLLDAMCLALFNRTPRLSGRGGATLGRDVDGLRANDPRTLARRSAATASAEVDFVGRDGRTYRARWSVRRARGQAFGRLQEETVTLVDVASGMQLGDGKEDTLEKIVDALGLAFDEFCRSVLLAQGGFSSFLKAKADERAALLEKITGTSIYSTLSVRAFERARDEQAKAKALDDELAAMPPASADARTALDEAVRDAARTRDEAAREVEHLEAVKRHRERARDLTGALAAARAALTEVEARRASSEEAKAVTALERVWPLRPLLHALDRAARARVDSEAAVASSVVDERRALHALSSARERRARADEAFAHRARALALAEPLLLRAVVLDEQIVRAGADEARDALNRVAKELADVDDELEAVRTSRAVAAGDLHRANEVLAREPALVALLPAWSALAAELAQLASADTELAGARAIASAAERNRDEARVQRARSEQRKSEAERCRGEQLATLRALVAHTDLDDVSRALTEAAGENMRRRALVEADVRATSRVERTKHALSSAERALSEAETQRARATASMAHALRAHLEDGEPCPVCGSLEHPIANEHASVASTVLLGATNANANASLVEAEATRAAAAARVDELRGQLAHAEAEAARVAVPSANALDDDAIARARAALSEARRADDELRSARDELRDADAELAVVEQALALHARAVEEKAHVRAERARSLAERLPSFDGDDARNELANPRAVFTSLKPRIDGLRTQQQTALAATAALAQSEPHLRAVEQRRAAVAARVEHATELAAAAARKDAELRRERAALFSGEAASSVRARLSGDLDDARVAAADAIAALAAVEVRASEAQRRRSEAEVNLARARHDELDAEAALAGRSRDEAAIEAARLPDDALERAKDALRAIENDVARAEAVLAERAAALDEHVATAPSRTQPASTTIEPGDDDVGCVLDDARRALSDASEAWAASRAAVAADDTARERASALEPRVEAQRAIALTWQKLADLIGSADGARFRVFAQSLTLDALLTHANAQLATLAPRYRLERATPAANNARFDLDLVVVDRESSDDARAVSSLSGGETFLVSLALALGLSALSSTKSSVESLFIDEGFSSLDPETLEAALAALETLRATGRQIGVISHVPALVERIGAQVRVVPLGGGRSRVDISQSA